MRDFSFVKRIVVKVGTNMLSSNGGIDKERIGKIASQISRLKDMGKEVLLVSSGAVGLGAYELGHKNKVVHIPMRQACASIGQPLLMACYREAFSRYSIICSQIMLTRNDLNNRKTYNNLRSSVSTLLTIGVVPIFNENDVVSTAEVGTAFGDNDRMSAMVASKIDADLLVLLTDIDGLYTGNPKSDKDARLISDVKSVTAEIMAYAKGAGSAFSTGGMKTKLQAAQIAALAGCTTVIASGFEGDILVSLLNGEEKGTCIHPLERLTQRQRWIINNSHKGSIKVDEGAYEALLSHRSLLPKGICGVSGVFDEGDVVRVVREDGTCFAKAVPYYNSTDIAIIMGHNSADIEKLVGSGHKDCIFRPEDLVFVKDAQSL